ncbi:MAG: TIGR03643 family protein [Trichodesmium sp. MAG_R04]|nr:TIGR03643 family protein [Trichodesmium sp. MAG_R04]
MNIPNLDNQDVDRIVEMAWEDRTPFEAIKAQFGLQEKQVIVLMRRSLSISSFNMWRKRVTGRKTKHTQRRAFNLGRFKSKNQKN